MSRYQFIGHCSEAWPVQVLCQVLDVSCAGYYQWLGRAQPTPAPWQAAAQAAFTRHARRYGTRRLRAELRAQGHAVGRYALRSWLHRHGLRALSTRPLRPRTTVADPAAAVAENRLLGQPAPTAPDQVWVGDITYLPLVGGRWCYLATWRDACSRRVVGWHLAAQMPTELVLLALEQALTLRQPAPGLIIHADRGSQYTSTACRARVAQASALASFSRPGNPYDNAQAEAGWSTLTTELLPGGSPFASLEEARLEVAWYLDAYFNLDRRHSALGYRSPHQFEQELKTNLPQLTVRFYWTTPLQQLRHTLRLLDQHVQEIEAELLRLLAQHFATEMQLLCSIPGIGRKTAGQLLLFAGGFTRLDNYRQLIALAGLSPREHSSGTSIRGKARITKMGGALIRSKLFMCSFAAKKGNAACKALYDRLVANSKNGKVALIAVCNKLLKQAFAIVQSGVPYQADFTSKLTPNA